MGIKPALKTARNKQIYLLWKAGQSYSQIARDERFDLTRQRVRRICIKEAEREANAEAQQEREEA